MMQRLYPCVRVLKVKKTMGGGGALYKYTMGEAWMDGWMDGIDMI